MANKKDFLGYDEDFVNKFMEHHGFCGCGNPDELIRQVMNYLEKREHPIKTSDDELLMAYFCDREGYTEHGTSVYSAWTSEKGWGLVEQVKLAEIKEEE